MILEDFIRFSNNSGGFEKILKGSQGFCQILASPAAKHYILSNSAASKGWGQAQHQLGIGRRFIRFLWFLESAIKMEESRKGKGGGILKILITGKWACFALFTFSEACTVLHAMGIRQTHLTGRFQRIGMKFWFFSICFSIMASLTQLMPHILEAIKDPELDMAFGESDETSRRSSGLFDGPQGDDPRRTIVNGVNTRGPVNNHPRAGPVNSDPRAGPVNYDPRAGPVNYDPRAVSVNNYPRAGPVNYDPRAGLANDPRDPRNSDPRAGPRIDVNDPLAGPVLDRKDPRAGPVLATDPTNRAVPPNAYYVLDASRGNSPASSSSSSSPKPSAAEKTEKARIDAEMERRMLFIDASKNTPAAPPSLTPIILQLMADVCDLTIPGANVGWFHVGPEVVGAAFVANAVLSGTVIWKRVNASGSTVVQK